MIDFHNHILPNVDDGSKSVEMSLDMLREAENQGITDVVNTVHYQHPKMEGKNTSYDFIISEINKLQSAVDQNNINIKIHPGSEVFFSYNLTEILDNPITTIGNGKYMLIEFQTLAFPKHYEETIFKLQTKGVTPIIAHPERYRSIQNDISIVEGWIDRGYIIQIDCGSLLNHFNQNTMKVAKKMIKQGLCHIVGSDSHNNKKRNFCLKDALNMIEKLIGNGNTSIIKLNSERILSGEKCKNYQLGRKFFFPFLKK